MRNLKTYSEFEVNEASVPKWKFKWKREERTTGRYSAFADNDLRGYECTVLVAPGYLIKDGDIGYLTNPSRHEIGSMARNREDTDEWAILIIGKSSKGGGNFRLKQRFKFDDVAGAKKYFEAAFVQIMTDDRYMEMRNQVLAMKRLEPIAAVSESKDPTAYTLMSKDDVDAMLKKGSVTDYEWSDRRIRVFDPQTGMAIKRLFAKQGLRVSQEKDGLIWMV